MLRFRRRFAVASMPAILLASSAALAQPAPSNESGVAPVSPDLAQERPTVTTSPRTQVPASWYGDETLAADGISLMIALAGATSDSGLPALAAVAGYLVGAPAVHLAHENGWRALGSFGLRAGVPLTAFGVGYYVVEDCDDSERLFCGVGSLVVGGIGGIASAIALDARFLAWEYHKVAPKGPAGSPARPIATVQLAPMISPALERKSGAQWVGLGAHGTF